MFKAIKHSNLIKQIDDHLNKLNETDSNLKFLLQRVKIALNENDKNDEKEKILDEKNQLKKNN